ncbi:hypothetical protein QQF64_007105 [Cirrhinus molitorella]|uniref:Uncharacterized protein n=1 Tax=Cirrhinus molitorella TaxID=172907 RepID=A0ABR3MAE5_9TELE
MRKKESVSWKTKYRISPDIRGGGICGFTVCPSNKEKEDLSPEDREQRNKLWPLVEKARQQGCRAHFIGPKTYIDGKELVLQDIEVTE